MKKDVAACLRLTVALSCLFLVAGNRTASGAAPFKILFPPDKAVVGGAGLAHVVVELDRAVALTLRFNGKLLSAPQINDRIHHYLLRLEFGPNSVEVEARQGERLLGRDRRELFFFSPIAKEKEIPQGFAPRPFHHAGKTNGGCQACHILEPQKGDFAPPKREKSSCHACHRELTQFKQVHGPASLWNCLRCHDPKSRPLLYATPVPVRDLCYQCHTDQKEYFFSARYQHGPTATGMCTICHNPHASDNEFWLKKEPWDLCTTCHVEKASGRHIIAWGPTGDTHPTRGRPDPMKPEREFSCRSCHNPHASNAPKLWNFNVTEAYQLCWTCHRK